VVWRMKAVTWQGKRDVRVDEVPDPTILQPTNAIIAVSTTNFWGSTSTYTNRSRPSLELTRLRGHHVVAESWRMSGE